MSVMTLPPLPLTPAPSTRALPAVTPPQGPTVFRLTVAQYDRMVEVGILTTADRVELLDGYLVAKMPSNSPHDGSVSALNVLVGRVLPSGWIPRVQQAVELATSKPEPDFSAVRVPLRLISARTPLAAETGLVVEVADSSLAFDRQEKLRLYAAANIPVYWIVNIPDRQIEVYETPSGPTPTPGYASKTVYLAGQNVPVVLNGTSIGSVAAVDLLP